jgi:serine/threonine protein phosphatase 1
MREDRGSQVWKWVLGRKTTTRPSLPPGVQIYAIGDIHGRVDLLSEVFKKITADSTGHPALKTLEIYLGDYIDRGPTSREVLDQLIDRARKRNTVFIRGNHETYPIKFLGNPEFLTDWRQLGGLETLISYGLKPSRQENLQRENELAREFEIALPPAHRAFLKSLRPSFACGDFYFVHGGVRPGVPLAQQRAEDLLEIRDEFLSYEDDFGKIIVHGHTPVIEPEFKPNRINIDTGAYATGNLTCLAINEDKLWLL